MVAPAAFMALVVAILLFIAATEKDKDDDR